MQEQLKAWLSDPLIVQMLAALALIVAVSFLVHFTQKIVGRSIENPERRYRTRKFVTFGGYLVTVFMLSILFSDQLSGLTVFFGVAGAGVAFALQEIIASAAGWVAMSFGRFYQIGDRVQLGGIVGDVIDIGVLRTTLMECGGWIKGDQYNGRVVRVANSFIFKEPVFNYSADFPFLWDEISIPIQFGSNYELARTEFQAALEDITSEHARRLRSDWRKMTDKYMLENARLEPMVILAIKENWVEYGLRYVVEYKQRRITKDKICMRALAAIEASNNQIRLGAPSFAIASAPPLDLNIRHTE